MSLWLALKIFVNKVIGLLYTYKHIWNEWKTSVKVTSLEIETWNIKWNISMYSRETEWIWCFQCKDRSCCWQCYCWTFTNGDLPANKVFTWQRCDSKSCNKMLVPSSFSTFSRWSRDTMFRYSKNARNNSKSFAIRPIQRTCHWAVYCEPKDEIIIGNFLSPTEQVPTERPQKWQKRVSVPEKETIQCKDIRLLFRRQEQSNKNQDKK